MTDTQDKAQHVLEVNDVSYWYKSRQALSHVSFAVDRRSIHGFVGPNGAGKTTALKVLATLMKPMGGRVLAFGLDVVYSYKAVRKRIGFMPDHISVYRQMTVFEYLDFFAAAYGMGVGRRNQVIENVLALTDMDSRRDELIRSLSQGMQQRVGLARVLVHDPELLLLDEPASGLDPRARIELMEILQELRRMGKTVFISSHILSELGNLCDAVTIIDRGAIKYSGSMQGLLTSDGQVRTYLLTTAEPSDEAEAALRATPGVREIVQDEDRPTYRITFDRDQVDMNRILTVAIQSGAQVVSLEEDHRQLSQAFMDLTEPGVPT